jgi:hypothetical protein
MKRQKTNNTQVSGIQTLSLEQLNAETADVKMSHEQLLREVAILVRNATGTGSLDVGHRFIQQLALAQVWPAPQGNSDKSTQGVSLVWEMAPQNATEVMLAAQGLSVGAAPSLVPVSRNALAGLSPLAATKMLS